MLWESCTLEFYTKKVSPWAEIMIKRVIFNRSDYKLCEGYWFNEIDNKPINIQYVCVCMCVYVCAYVCMCCASNYLIFFFFVKLIYKYFCYTWEQLRCKLTRCLHATTNFHLTLHMYLCVCVCVCICACVCVFTLM
eukprot:GHVR01084310.1.p2 GENE.GHVR01084310.1~~GHVR01084310.1.p2  ORF type:complete len:136 (+),score=30.12 GHVR01084310.1:1177-1584(+)